MVPNKNAGANLQEGLRFRSQDRGESQLVCHATAVAVHTRPRSPGFSPAKYVRPDESRSPQRDIMPQRDVVGRTGPQGHPQPSAGRGPHSNTQHLQFRPPANSTAQPSAVAHLAAPSRPGGHALPSRTSGPGHWTQAPAPSAPTQQQHADWYDSEAARISATAAAVAGITSTSRQVPPQQTLAMQQPAAAVGKTAGGSANSGNTNSGAAATGAALLAEILGPQPPRITAAPSQPARTAAAAAATAGAYSASGSSAPAPPPSAATSHLGRSNEHRGGAPVSAASGAGAAAPGWGGGRSQALSQPLLAEEGGARSLAALGLLGGVGVGVGGGVEDPEEEARRARRRHRRRVARIVVDHWKHFAGERLRALAAKRHHHRRLLTAALVAWQAEAAAARARMRQAAVYDLKRAYLGLGRCLQAWRDTVKRLMTLRLQQERFMVARLTRQTRACLRAWRGRCYHAAEKRRMQLQAWYYLCFSTLTRALRKWHAWTKMRRAKASRAGWADAMHAAVLGRKTFTAWRRRRAYLQWKEVAITTGAAFRRLWVLRSVVQGWRTAVRDCAMMRRAGCVALAAVAEGLQTQQAAAAFREWQAHAAGKRRRRQRERYALAYMRRWRQLVVMWALRQQAARQRHLRRCEQALQPVGRRLRLALWWGRWWCGVAVLQGQRTAELRAAVQLRACWATWRATVEAAATKRELPQLATKRVQRIRAAAALNSWRSRTAHWRAKAAAWSTAAAWRRRRLLGRLLAGWRSEAARRVAKAVAVEAAEVHRRRVVLCRAVRLWKRYAWRRHMKVYASQRHLTRMAAAALGGWLRHTRYKARKELNRRRAVRHRYLMLLHSGLAAFRRAVERRRAKQADWADLVRLHSLHVARAVLAAWSRRFVPAALAKRAVGRQADLHRARGLMRRALAGWGQQAARLAAKHARERQASGHAALRLLRRAMVAWADAPALQTERREAKAARLEAAAAALAAAAARRLLAAWREVHGDLVMKRFQNTRAHEVWRVRTLRHSLTNWALYLAHRRTRRMSDARARAAWRLHVWRGVLAALAAAAAARRVKRRLLAAAEEHRRNGLLRRGLAALAWYGRYRAAKAHGYAAARAQFTRRLQREGAVAWLEAGLARRQRRIEGLAAAQAHSLARQLALVQPYARRWLHAVRCRRRQRLLALAGGTSAPTFGSHFTAAAAATVATAGGFSGYPLPALAAGAAPWQLSGLSVGLSSATATTTAAAAAAGGGPVAKGVASAGVNVAATTAAAAVMTKQPMIVRRPPPRTPPALHTHAPLLAPQQQHHHHQQQQQHVLHNNKYNNYFQPEIQHQGRQQQQQPQGLQQPAAVGEAGTAATGAAAVAAAPAATRGVHNSGAWACHGGEGVVSERAGMSTSHGLPQRARPQPRCPDFLLRRPATVDSAGPGIAPCAAANVRQDLRTVDDGQLGYNAASSGWISAAGGGGGATVASEVSLAGYSNAYSGAESSMPPSRATATGVRAATVASPSAGITIHRSGPLPPDVLRLPTRDGSSSDASGITGVAFSGYEGYLAGDAATSGAFQVDSDYGAGGHNITGAATAAGVNVDLNVSMAAMQTHGSYHPHQAPQGLPQQPVFIPRPMMQQQQHVNAIAATHPAMHHAGVMAAAGGSGASGPEVAAPVVSSSVPGYVMQAAAPPMLSGSQSMMRGVLPQHAQRGAVHPPSQPQLHPQQLPSQRGGAATLPEPPQSQLPYNSEELAELESLLSYCKSLKDLLNQLESGGGGGMTGLGAGAEAAGLEGRRPGGVAGGQGNAGSREEEEQRQRQAAEVRATLNAMRPAVEVAASMLRQIRGLG
ncbi:hypothetical protein Agub_g2411 [Astrephomene gubernaculifera]|uniref:Sfi1 spindle body domain-containing protein n=1 Tax=Astrephomene gubernaculifera TaxID=47775 RepID=A0AAD3DHI7_9CHLO|nr:hypothetical protein Agub_g2411 [Astrephomene gubernaculifera]